MGTSDNAESPDVIAHTGRADTDYPKFLYDVLSSECFLTDASEGAILRITNEKKIDILAVYPAKGSTGSASFWLSNSITLCNEAILKKTLVTMPVQNPQQLSRQSGDSHVLMLPIIIAGLGNLVLAILVTANNQAELETISKKLKASVALVNSSQTGITQQRWQSGFGRLQQSLGTLSAVNQYNKFTSSAMAFCNEAAAQWQCERVSLGFMKGRYVKLKTMSHTESFSRRMKVVQDIESVMEECFDQDIEVITPAQPSSAYISRTAEKLSQKYGPLAVLSLPLRYKGQVVAVATLERPIEKVFSTEEVETIRLTCELCTIRLYELFQNDRWLGAIIAARSRSALAKLVGPRHTWLKLAVVFIFCAIMFLVFGEGQYRCESPFVVEATVQQVIPAPFDGYIKNIEVEVGDSVTANESVLGNLDTSDLRLRLAEAKAKKVGYEKEFDAAMSSGETASRQIAQANADMTQAQIDLLEYQISKAELICPISGVVVQGDLKRKIGAPVKTGEVLFEVCPLESLRAELHIPEEQIYDIQVGQEGSLVTVSYPGQRIKFTVERINPIAEVVGQRNVFKVRVKLLETFQWMRPGMEGVAKVDIGKRKYIWMWSRKIVNWIRMKLWL